VPDAMIDTSVLVDLLRGYAPASVWLKAQGKTILGVSSIATLELIRGSQNKTDLNDAVQLLSQFERVDLTSNDQQWAIEQYADKKLAHGLGMNDALIAAPAHRLELTLYTHNLKHIQPLLQTAKRPY